MIEKADGDYDGRARVARARGRSSIRATAWCSTRWRASCSSSARYAEALAVLDGVAAVDPEDVQMHYTAMLAARGLGDEARAAREEQLFLRFKADESAQAITARPRLLSPRTTTSASRSTSTRACRCSRSRSAHGSRPMTRSTSRRPRWQLVAPGVSASPVPRPQPRRASRSPTSPPPPASGSSTTAAAPGRSGCPRRWAPASRSSTPTATAGSTSCSSTARTGQPRRAPIALRALPEQRQRQLHGHHAPAAASTSRLYGMGVAVGDYDNDGRDDVYLTALEGDRLFHNEGGGQVPRRDEGGRHRQRQLRHQRRLARLRQATAGSISSSPTTCSGRRRPTCWCSLDGATKSYCTPESYKGTASKLYRNLGGGRVRGRDQKAGRRRPDQQVARHRRARLRQRRLARPVRRQRHAAEQAVSQQPERHVHRGRAARRRRLQRGRHRARRHGRRCRRLRSLGPPAPAGRQLLEPDARPLSQRGQRPVRGRGAALDRRAAPAC